MNNFLYYKVNSNQLSGTVDYLNVNETTQYKMIDSLPTPPQNGMLVYHQNDLKLYNNNQWESIANTNTNETFNNLTVVSSLNVSGNTSLKNTIVDNLTVNSSLFVSGNTNLKNTVVDNLTVLSSLNVSGNTSLKDTTLNNITGLASLNISGNTNLKNTIVDNLTINSSLYVSGASFLNGFSIYGYTLPKQASITYKIEKIGITWILTFFSSSQFNGLDLDASNNSADWSKGVVYLNKSACGINNIIDISIKMTYCDDPNTCLQVRPDTLLFNSIIPPNPAPNVIKLYTYVYDQFRVINDLDVDSAGTVFIWTVNIFGY